MNHHILDSNLLNVSSFLAISRTYFGLPSTPDLATQKLALTPVAVITPNPPRKKMNNYRMLAQSVLLLTGLGALFAAPTFAESNCGSMSGYEAHAEYHAKMIEERHKQLHDALKLAPEQEAGWKKLMDAEQPKLSSAGAKVSDDWSKLSTPERAEKTLELYKARQEHMAQYVAALKGFYVTLSPEQTKIFEDMHASQRSGMGGKSRSRAPNASNAPPKS